VVFQPELMIDGCQKPRFNPSLNDL
jgi:hypothetical protein